MVNSGRGRAPGLSRSREDLVLTAQRQFLARGYDRATVRSIADEAGVDHAMVNYWFGGKEGLLRAVLDMTVTPGEVVEHVIAEQPEDLAVALLTAAVDLWDRPAVAATFRRLLDAAVTGGEGERVVREYLGSRLAGRLEEVIGGRDARQRTAAATALMGGLFMTRSVLRIEPIASMSRQEVVRVMAPPLRLVLERPPRRRGPGGGPQAG